MKTTYQSSNSYQPSSFSQQNSPQRATTSFSNNSDLKAEREAFLKYAASGDSVVVSGTNDQGILLGLKDAIQKLKTDYFSKAGAINIKSDERVDLDKRFLLFQHELDGLLRRRIQYTGKDYEGGTRNLDFTSLLNEKQNQVVELERKILNLEDRLKRASKREVELQNKIALLNAQNLSLRDKSLTGTKLDLAVQLQADNERLTKDIQTIRANFALAASIWKNQVALIRSKYPNEKFDLDTQIIDVLQKANVKTYNINGFETVEVKSEKIVEVPVLDTKTKALISLFAKSLKSLTAKYPKILTEIDTRIAQFFSQQFIDVIEVDQIDKIVEIVKFVPQTVRVQNVYKYTSSQSRRLEFHLRILIKALLEELEKIRLKTGVVLEMDEAVINMIKEQILGIVNVDDILKVFRIVPKIVEVEKIIEKITERVVEVPQVISVEKIVQKVIQVPRVKQIEKVIHVPVEVVKVVENVIEKIIEVPSVIQKIVEVPKIIEKIVEKIIEVPKIVEIQKIVQKIVINTQVVTVQKPVNKVIYEPKQVIVYRDKVVIVQKVVQKIVQVPTYIEKIVEKVVQIERIKPVQFIKEIIVQISRPEPFEKQTIIFKQIPTPIERIVQKIVVVENIIQKIVQVPQVIQKIIQVTVQVPKMIQVEKIVEKLVPVIQIKQVEKINNVIVPLVKQVQKIVDRRVQVPIIQERIVQVPTIVNQIVIEKVEVPKIIEVERWHDKIITEIKLIEVQKPVVYYIKDVQIVKASVEKIVQVPRTIEKIKQVKVKVEKIVEKLIEVPKIVQVQKVVEKIVIVPRIIERVVQVPQIVQVIVEKIVQKEVIREVPVITTIPVEIQKPIQIQIVKNVYIEIEKPVDKIIEKILPVERVITQIQVVENIVEKIVPVKKQVPKQIIVQKIVPVIVETQVFVEVEKPVTLIVEIPVQVVKIIQKAIAIPYIQEKIVQVPQIVEKVVQVLQENTKVIQVQKIVEKIVEVIKTNVINQKQFIIQEKVKQIPTQKQIIVPQKQTVKQQVPVLQVVQKLVERAIQIPKVVQIQRIVQKMVQRSQIVQLQTILPQMVKVHQIVKEYIEKIITVPVIQQVIKQIRVQTEKIVQVHSKEIQIKQVQTIHQKTVTVQKIKEYTNTVNHVQKQLQFIDRLQQKQVPIFSTVEKIVEVPQILEKIVERIVVMPQIVEVLKYVHEIYEDEDLGAPLTGDIQVAQTRYKQLYGNAKKQLQILLIDLKKIKTSQPNLRGSIQIIERYLVDFDKLAATQRIVTIDREKVVQKQVSKGVLVPTHNTRGQLAMSLLVEKLILEIKRIKKDNPNVRLSLDDEIGLIFFSELYDKQNVNLSGNFQSNLKKYTEQAIKKFTKNGGKWTADHEIMLNTVLTERFAMANTIKYANQQIEKAKSLAEIKATALREKEGQLQVVSKIVQDLYKSLSELQNHGVVAGNSLVSKNIQILGNLISSSFKYNIGQPTQILGDFQGSGNDFNRLLSIIRQKDGQIDLLKIKLIDSEKRIITNQYSGLDSQRTIASLRTENASLVRQLQQLKNKTSSGTSDAIKVRELELKLKIANSKNQQLESQLRSSQLQLKQFKQNGITSTRIDTSSSNYPLSSSNTYSSTSSSQVASYGANVVQEPTYGGVLGSNSVSTYQPISTSSYQTSVRVQTGINSPTSAISGTYASYNSSSYGTLSGSRTGVTGTSSTSYDNKSSNVYGTLSGSKTGTITSATTINAGNSSPTGAKTAVYGTASTSQSGATYGQSSTTSTSGQNYTSTYQKTTGTSGISGLGTGTVTTPGSSYTFQTKKY